MFDFCFTAAYRLTILKRNAHTMHLDLVSLFDFLRIMHALVVARLGHAWARQENHGEEMKQIERMQGSTRF